MADKMSAFPTHDVNPRIVLKVANTTISVFVSAPEQTFTAVEFIPCQLPRREVKTKTGFHVLIDKLQCTWLNL